MNGHWALGTRCLLIVLRFAIDRLSILGRHSNLEIVGLDIPGFFLLWGSIGVQAGRAGSDAGRDSHGPAGVFGRHAAAPQAEESGGDRSTLDDREKEEQPGRAVGLHGVGTELYWFVLNKNLKLQNALLSNHNLTGFQMIIRVSHADRIDGQGQAADHQDASV